MTKTTVAEFLSIQMEASGKLQTEIARDVGFDKPNVITMIKQGKTKLPLAKIGLMAQSLGIDPQFLLGMVMEEYHPEAWDVMSGILNTQPLTSNERLVVEALRAANVLPTQKIPDSDKGKIVRALSDALK